MPAMYALLSEEGLAASETALCDECYADPEARLLALAAAGEDVCMSEGFENRSGERLTCITCVPLCECGSVDFNCNC